MTEELVTLVEPEMKIVQQIIGKTCKIVFTTEGKLSLTGFKVSASIINTENAALWNNQICRFNLTQFPGNCGMMITHETYQTADYQKKGLSVPIQAMKAKIAKYYKYTIMLATTVPSNHNDSALQKAGFVRLDPLCFTNIRTTNKITTWMKTL